MNKTPLTWQTLSSEEVAVLFAVRDGGVMETSARCLQTLEAEGLLEQRAEVASVLTRALGTAVVRYAVRLTQAGRDALMLYEAGSV